MRSLGLVFVGVVLAACGTSCTSGRASRVETPVDLTIAPIGALPPSNLPPPDPGKDQCSLRLTADPIERSDRGCYLDEHISEGVGIVRYPCSGDGPAEASFGSDHYTGRVIHGLSL